MCTLKNEHVPPNENTRGYMYPQTEIWVGMLVLYHKESTYCRFLLICSSLLPIPGHGIGINRRRRRGTDIRHFGAKETQPFSGLLPLPSHVTAVFLWHQNGVHRCLQLTLITWPGMGSKYHRWAKKAQLYLLEAKQASPLPCLGWNSVRSAYADGAPIGWATTWSKSIECLPGYSPYLH